MFTPVSFVNKLWYPKAKLLDADKLLASAENQKALLLPPAILAPKLFTPYAELLLPVVLRIRLYNP